MDVELTDEVKEILKVIDRRMGLENFFEAAIEYPYLRSPCPRSEQEVLNAVVQFKDRCVVTLIFWESVQEHLNISCLRMRELHMELMGY